jgi:hypothetical protein
MIKRRPKRSNRELTPAERARVHQILQEVESEKPKILAKARELKKARPGTD